MRSALKMVLVDGASPSDAADKFGVSRHKLYLRRKQVMELLGQACPPGWKQVILFYPPSLQHKIDELLHQVIVVAPAEFDSASRTASPPTSLGAKTPSAEIRTKSGPKKAGKGSVAKG